MTVAAQTSNVVYTGNGATTNWAFDFEIPTGSDLVSLFDIPTGALTPLSVSDYIISGLDDPDGGTVTYTPALPATKRIVIERDLEYTQDLDLTTQSAYNPEDLESQLDRIVMQIQQLKADSDRAVKVTLGSTLDPDAFVTALQQAAADAAESAGEAADSAVLAMQWAENPEDLPVEPGLFSAHHWANKALAIVGTVTLPAVPVALNYLRRNAGNTAYENRTPAQARGDIFPTTPALNYLRRNAGDTDFEARTPAQVAADLSVPRYDASVPLNAAQRQQFAANVGAGMELIGFQKLGSAAASIDFTANLADYIELHAVGKLVPVTAGGSPCFRLSKNAGAAWISTSEYFLEYGYFAGGGQSANTVTTTYGALTGIGVPAARPAKFTLDISDFNVNLTSTWLGRCAYNNGAGSIIATVMDGETIGTAIGIYNGIQFVSNVGNLATGSYVYLYGQKG